MPEWVRHVVWWQIYPLGFTGAPGTAAADGTAVQHRLRRVENWLDYAVELGASGLALGPVFAAETHGYDTVDFLRIDARLGDDEDFDALIAAAGGRGLRVLLDGVFNHVGRGHPAFQAVLAEGPTAATASWFKLRWPADWQPGMEPDYDNFEGHGQLVALNHEEPAVADHIVEVMNHWLARGAAGWRLDAAYAVPPQFWARILPRVRVQHPDVYMVGEVIHGDYAAIVKQSGMDSVTQYELWKAVWSALNSANFFELAWALERHNEFLTAFEPLTFVGNHDVTRLASQLAEIRHLPLALVLLLTVGGTPSLYYGDEQAFRGVKEERLGGDDAIRPEFPEGPDQLAVQGWPMYRLHQELIGLRRRNAWLHVARTTQLELTNEVFVYGAAAGQDRLVVALNLGPEPVDAAAPNAQEVLAGAADVADPGGAATRVTLAGFGWAVLSA